MSRNKRSWYLVNDAHMSPQPVWTQVAHVVPVNLQHATGWVVESHQQCRQRRLSWTTWANHSRHGAARHDQIQTAEDGNLGPRRITEMDSAELDMTLKVGWRTPTFCNMNNSNTTNNSEALTEWKPLTSSFWQKSHCMSHLFMAAQNGSPISVKQLNLVKISWTMAEILWFKDSWYGGFDNELWPWPLKS